MKNPFKGYTMLSFYMIIAFAAQGISSAHISMISTDPNFESSSLRCGMNGGCRLHIQGSGFDLGYDNQVMVGIHPCEIDNYYTGSELIVCEMPSHFYGAQTGLQVVMRVRDQIVECRYRDCTVNFEYYRTPTIWSVDPQAVFAGQPVNVRGVFRSENMSDLKEVRISGRNCERTEDQMEEDVLSFWSYRNFQCTVPQDLEIGNHILSLTASTSTGFNQLMRDAMGFTVGTSTETYNLRVHPEIREISSSSGYLGGQVLEIKGNGFGKNKDEVKVNLEDTECLVLSLEEIDVKDSEGNNVETQKVTCALKSRASDFTNKLFKGGAGLRNQVFEGWDKNFTALFGDTDKTLRYDRTALVTENQMNEDQYVQRMWGVFRTKEAGTYTFKISGDDQTYLYLSSAPIDFSADFDSSIFADPKCFIDVWSSFREFNKYDTQSCDYTLEADTDYYMMAFNTEGGGGDHITIGVSTPNSDLTKPNQSPQIQKVWIDNNPTRQVIKLKIMNAIGGTFSLIFQERDPGTGEIKYYRETKDMANDIDADDLSEQIRRKTGWTSNVTRDGLNANEKVTTDLTKVSGFLWTISFDVYRNRDMLPLVNSDLIGDNVKSFVEEVTPQSASVEGSFDLQYGNSESVTINYNYSGNSMRDTLIRIDELFGGVGVYSKNPSADGREWYISMDSISGKSENLKVTANNLTGGSNGSPQVRITPEFVSHSSALQYLPIPSDFLNTIHTKPQITMTVGGMLAGCEKDNCDFSYLPQAETPSVTSFSLSGNKLTINVANPSGRLLAASDDASMDSITVRFGNVDCGVSSVAWPVIECDMPTNPDGSMQIESGNFLPQVHLKGSGYFSADANSLTEHVVALAVSGVSPSQGSIGGGTVITISGTGFANNSQYGNTNVVTVGGSPCKITSFNTSEIQCETPAESQSSGSEISVTVNGTEVTSSAFSYSDGITPKISSLSPNNSSPVLKKDLVINGTGFSSDPSQFTVWLKPEDADGKEYECNTVSSTTTTITCRLSGGKKGAYRIKVHMKGAGYSVASSNDADLFHYRTTVTSISPTSGSLSGGTVLTITGTNFSTILNENQVVIGESGSDYCIILTATPTELTCRVNAPKEVVLTEQDVFVLGRVQEEADCINSCKFTFDSSQTPTVSSISPTDAQTGNTITVTGTGFTASAQDTVITVGGATASNVVVTPTQITFDMPAIEFGSHEPKILVGNKGYAKYDEVIMLDSGLVMTSVSPNTGSKDGAILTINGNGFKTEDMEVKIYRTVCEIMSSTTNQIIASCGSITNTNVHSVNLTYTDADNESQTLTCDSCTYEPQSTRPYIRSIISTGPYDLDSVVIGIDGDHLKTNPQDSADLYDIADIRVWLVSADSASNFKVEGVASFTPSGVNCTFNNMIAGEYNISYHVNGVGYARIHSDVPSFVLNPVVSSLPAVESSLAGGSMLTFSGKGFPSLANKDLTNIRVCGQHCVVSESSYSTLKCKTPVLNTQEVQDSLSLLSASIQRDAVVTGDRTHSDMNRIIDGDVNTYYYGDNANDKCFAELDYGEHTVISATKLRLFPRPNSDEQSLVGGELQGSLDGTTYTTFATIDENIIENWNTFIPDRDTNEKWNFRYLRFEGHRCQIAEIEVTGFKFSDLTNINLSGHTCDVTMAVGGANATEDLTGKVTYKESITPQVTSLSPEMGTTVGGTTLTISGENFQSDSKVFIDGIECPTSSVTSTSITCTTGSRPEFTESTLEVYSETSGNAATNGNLFLYIDRWSDPNTWGGEAPPREGDSVHIPKGQILLVDVSPPPLYSVIVEGVIMWEDLPEMTFEAWFIMVREGQFRIGSPEKPHEGKLTITLHGTKESKMLPGFGNKSIMVHNGQIDIHGKPLAKTWTFLEKPALKGEKQITLTENSEWKVGDKIIIAPTGQDRDEVEERTITEVSGKVIKFDEPLVYEHFSGTIDPNSNHLSGGEQEVINTIDPPNRDGIITIRGEVGLLTRNVKVQGDETTMDTGHGAHIMVRGKEGVARGRFSYLEVFRAGQKFQLGRYPIHFHMIGHVVDNYVRGCAVHQTFNRGTTIHGVHYLVLEHNVYYRTMGHTIFLEDGIETNNVIQHNLVVHVRKSTSMLMSDLKPSGLWQARPTNFIRDNHFIGCAGNGTWFELVHHPTGPSATNTICSVADHLVQYDRNVHHSNAIGLRIYPHYFPKTDPCVSHFNNRFRDPFSHNPGMPARLNDNIMYMNSLGTFGKVLGAVQYVKQVMISNNNNQFVFRPKMAKDSLARTENSISIGESELVHFHQNEDGSPRFINTQAMLMPQKSGFAIMDTRFYNFSRGTMFKLCASCRNDKKRDIGGTQITWTNNQFKNIPADMFKFSFAEYDKDVMMDKDGSLLKVMTAGLSDADKTLLENGGWMTVWFPHLDIPECVKQTNRQICSDDCALCSNQINLRRLKHTILDDTLLLYGQDMKLFNLGKTNDDSNPNGFNTNMNGGVDTTANENAGRILQDDANSDESATQSDNPDDAKFGFNKFRNCQLSMNWRGWVSIVPTSYQFNFHFGTGVEWKEMVTENEYYWGLDGPELPMYFRHNYTEPRETYEATFEGVGAVTPNTDADVDSEEYNPDGFGTIETSALIKSSLSDTNSFGDFTIDSENQMIKWKIDEKRIGAFTNKVVYCTGSNCTNDPVSSNVIEDTIRLWSETSSWTSGVLPTADDREVIIEETWNMHLDVVPPNLKHLKIYGRLTFAPDVDNLELNAYLIEIHHGGELIIGSPDNRHTRNATINLLGTKASDYIVVTSDIAPVNKAILNKGMLHLYGVAPNVTWTHLTQKVSAGDAHFYVEGTNLGWNVGDELVVASSSMNHDEREKVVIKELITGSNTTEVKIEGTFAYAHYGSQSDTSAVSTSTIDSIKDKRIDLRAEVGNLTRNVKIASDLSDEWGCTILTPSFNALGDRNAEVLQGHLDLRGVEIKNCGQRDTRKAAIDLNWVKLVRGSHTVDKCSFNNGQGWGLNMENAEGLTFTNNVMYNMRRYGIYLGKSIKAVTINDNLIVGIKIRENYNNVEYFDTVIGIFHDSNETHWDEGILDVEKDTPSEAVRNQIVMKRNSVSSSPWFGYAVPGVNCNERTKERLNFVDNVAHSNRGGWIPMKINDQDCALFSHFYSYKNWEQGFVQRADIKEMIAEHFVLADNKNGIVINGGNGKVYPNIKFRHSVINGRAMIDCPECYTGDDCETTGFISGLYNKNPYDFYWEDTRLPMHNSTNVRFTFGGTQEVDSVAFVNFKKSDECPDTKQTAIRMNNFYQDNGNYVTFSNLTLEEVDDENKLFFPNHKKHLDKSAYCGKVDCTANYNTLFVDVGGDIMGTGKTMHFFGNNKGAGRDGDCTFFEEWNGHACNSEYAQLLLTREPDERGLNIFPLILKIEDYAEDKSDDLKFYMESNGPGEVYSLIKKGVTTTVSTSQTMPSGLTYQLMSESTSDFVIIKIQSENPASMNVKVRNPYTQRNNRRKKPIVVKPGKTLDMLDHKSTCGANYYEPKNRILHFVVTGKDCEVKIEFTNALQLSTRLNIDPDTFFDTDGITTFLDRMAALLEISVDRIKVVDVRKGSTIVVTEIMSETDVTEERSDKDAVIKEFEDFKAKFESAVANNEVDLGAPVLDIETEMAIDNVEPVVEPTDTGDNTNGGNTTDGGDEDPVDEGSNKTRNILLGILIPIGVIVLAVGAYFIIKKCKGTKEAQPQSSKFNVTKDMTSNRDNIANNYVINNNQAQKFGGTQGDMKIKKQISLNPNNKLESYIKRKS